MFVLLCKLCRSCTRVASITSGWLAVLGPWIEKSAHMTMLRLEVEFWFFFLICWFLRTSRIVVLLEIGTLQFMVIGYDLLMLWFGSSSLMLARIPNRDSLPKDPQWPRSKSRPSSLALSIWGFPFLEITIHGLSLGILWLSSLVLLTICLPEMFTCWFSSSRLPFSSMWLG